MTRDAYGDPTDRPRVRGAVFNEGRHIAKPALLGSPLEPMEEMLMAALVHGSTINEFTDLHGLSPNTAHNWTSRIRDRLGARTMFEAVHLWTMSKPIYWRLRRKAHGDVNRGECDE